MCCKKLNRPPSHKHNNMYLLIGTRFNIIKDILKLYVILIEFKLIKIHYLELYNNYIFNLVKNVCICSVTFSY